MTAVRVDWLLNRAPFDVAGRNWPPSPLTPPPPSPRPDTPVPTSPPRLVSGKGYNSPRPNLLRRFVAAYVAKAIFSVLRPLAPPPLSHLHPPLLHFALRAPNAFSRGINIPAPSGENWDRGKETSLLTPRRFPSPAGRGLMRGDAVRRTAATLMGRIMRRITAERKRGM